MLSVTVLYVLLLQAAITNASEDYLFETTTNAAEDYLFETTTDTVDEYPYETTCAVNNISAELELLTDIYNQTQLYLHSYTYRAFTLVCCATGYSYIKWSKNGVELNPEDYNKVYEYNNDTTREQLLWYSLALSDCIKDTLTPFYTCTFTCEAYSVDEQETASRNISVILFHIDPPKQLSLPEFSYAEAEDCLVEGQDLHAFCRLQYVELDGNFPKKIEILMKNNISLRALSDRSKPMDSRRIITMHSNLMSNPVDYNVTVKNVTSEFLNQTYTCRSDRSPDVTRSFHVAKCGNRDGRVNMTTVVKVESTVSIKVAIPVTVLVALAVIVLIILIRFNVHINLWYKVHIVQRLQHASDSHKYDVYFIYKDVSHPAVLNSIQMLEKIFNMTLCLPDRDFTTGAMTPELIGDGLSSSQMVVAFLSNEMFEKGKKAHDWSDVSLSLALALNKKVIIFLLEDIDSTALKGRNEVKAALKILHCVKNFSGDKTILHQTFSKHFSGPIEFDQQQRV